MTSGRGDLGGMTSKVGGQGEDIGADAERCQALDKEIDGGDESAVRDISSSVSAGEDTTNPTSAINDDRPRISTLGERAGFRVARKHPHLLRHLTGFAFEIFAEECTDGVEATDGNVRGVAVLQNHNNRIIVVILGPLVRAEHLLVGDGPVESKKAVSRVYE